MPTQRAGPSAANGSGWRIRLPPAREPRAWLALMAALTLHVFDEAVTGFVPVYNELVAALKAKWDYFPFFTFPSFEAWLGPLAVALVIGFALTGRVARGGPGIRLFASAIAVLLAGNGLAHVLGSFYLGEILPGFWSAWVMLPAAVWMTYLGIAGSWRGTPR